MLTLAVLTLLTAIALLLVGLRGRPIDDHPLCRQCDYDLSGGPKLRCPECGANLSRRRSVRLGHRRARYGLLVTGSLSLAPAIAVVGNAALDRVEKVRLVTLAPMWWLRRQVDSADTADRNVASAELLSRMYGRRLSMADVASLVDHGLTARSTGIPWRWNGFIEAAHKAGQLDAERWVAYVRPTLSVSLLAPPAVPFGDSMGVRVVGQCQCTEVSSPLFDVVDLRVDGRPVPGPAVLPPVHDCLDHQGRLGTPFAGPQPVRDGTIGALMSGLLPIGPHLVAATVRIYLYDGYPDAKSQRGLPLPASVELQVSAPFTVYDPRGASE